MKCVLQEIKQQHYLEILLCFIQQLSDRHYVLNGEMITFVLLKKRKTFMLWEFLFVQLQRCSYEIHASSHCIDITRITCDWQVFYTNSCPFFHYFVFLSQIQSLSQLTSTIDILLFQVTILYIHSKYPGLSDKFLRLASFLNKQESSYTYAFAIIKSKITNND